MQAGSAGVSFEPMLPLKPVVARHDQTHCIITSKVGAHALILGSKEQVRSEIGATLAVARDCWGFICAVGNQLPANVSPENARFYMEYLWERWGRQGG